ncbi:MAG: hypothetical protein J7549_05775 [Variovorax sp.]|nr:hypothetical protein [Variovorax sp.]
MRAPEARAGSPRLPALAALGLLAAALWAAQALRAPPRPAPAPAAAAPDDGGADALRQELLRLDHALRTPIGAANAALALLETATDDAALQAQARQVIARQLARMTALTEELRALARRHPD